jgi:hypothetical protein
MGKLLDKLPEEMKTAIVEEVLKTTPIKELRKAVEDRGQDDIEITDQDIEKWGEAGKKKD